MTEQTAMRMALEALEKSRIRIVEQGGSGWKLEAQRCVNAITALRQALEQQPADEPVAWMFQHEETRRMNYVSNDGMNSPEFFMRMNQRYSLVCALYTRPPPAAWVGLTNVEIGTIAYNINPLDGITDFVRAIEAALRSKNT